MSAPADIVREALETQKILPEHRDERVAALRALDALVAERDEAKAQFWQQRHEWAAATGRNQEMIDQLLAALSVIPPDRLELLANWLDVIDTGAGGTEVQADLREMARLSRAVFETE